MKKILSIILSLVLIMAFSTTSFGFAPTVVKSIKINNSNVSLEAGKTFMLKVTISPESVSNKSSQEDRNAVLSQLLGAEHLHFFSSACNLAASP